MPDDPDFDRIDQEIRINELRLPLSDPQAQKVFDDHMLDFLNLKDVWEELKQRP